MLRLFALLAVLTVAVDSLGFQQSAAVRGVITCNGSPAGGLKIKLVDHDTFTPSDRMAEGITRNDGTFELHGHKSEITGIRPELRVYHRCNRSIVKFWRACSKIRIPPQFVSRSAAPDQTFDAGEIRLESMASNC
ncbi:Ttr-18 [Aphelenchoides fujianensis]|nr:Ttr-18 [Aphelenchoides fujianensis]